MGPEHEDSFDVARPAGAGDERDETRVAAAVFPSEQFERGGKIGNELVAPGEHEVMRR